MLIATAPAADAILSTRTASCPDDQHAQVTAWFRNYVYLEVEGLGIGSAGSGLRMVEVRASTPGSHQLAAATGIENWETAATYVECGDLPARRWSP